MQLTLKILDVAGGTIAQKTADGEVVLVHRGEYSEGEHLVVEVADGDRLVALSFESLGLACALFVLAGVALILRSRRAGVRSRLVGR